jgi:hypothetical protein
MRSRNVYDAIVHSAAREAQGGFKTIQRALVRGFVTLATIEIVGFSAIFVLIALQH